MSWVVYGRPEGGISKLAAKTKCKFQQPKLFPDGKQGGIHEIQFQNFFNAIDMRRRGDHGIFGYLFGKTQKIGSLRR
jgi:hypothetical protein